MLRKIHSYSSAGKSSLETNRATMAWLSLACMISMMIGCNQKVAVTEVTGVVTMNGKPMELIHVEFWSKNGPRSYGKTDTEGKFELKIDDGSARKGVVVGEQKVSLRGTWPTKDDYLDEGGAWVDKSDGKKSRIDTKYFDAVNSPMTVNVESGKKNFFELKVDPAQ